MSPSKKSRRRRKPPQRRDRFAPLKRKLAQGPFHADRLVIAPPGQVKMSEVLGDFVEPYLDSADTEEAYRKLLTLALVAWNASFLPPSEQQDMLDRVFDAAVPDGTPGLKPGLINIVNMLIERKQTHFAQYTRQIIDFELTDVGRGYHLTVASTVDPEDVNRTVRERR